MIARPIPFCGTFSAGYWGGGEVGYNLDSDEWFAEAGLVSPGYAFSVYYVSDFLKVCYCFCSIYFYIFEIVA